MLFESSRHTNDEGFYHTGEISERVIRGICVRFWNPSARQEEHGDNAMVFFRSSPSSSEEAKNMMTNSISFKKAEVRTTPWGAT